jgi:hypothetical protein
MFLSTHCLATAKQVTQLYNISYYSETEVDTHSNEHTAGFHTWVAGRALLRHLVNGVKYKYREDGGIHIGNNFREALRTIIKLKPDMDNLTLIYIIN